MIRRVTKHLGIVAIVGGAFMVAVPALAYVDTAPGSGSQESSTSTAPGQPVTVKVIFSDLPPGTNINFSASSAALAQTEAFVTDAEAATCTVTLNPTSAALDATHAATTQATPSAGCAGLNVTVTGTGPQGQTESATFAVTGGFPNTSASPVPFGWIVMAIGAVLVLVGIAGVAWRRQPLSARA